MRKKIERVYSDEAKTGIFEEDNPFLEMISDDLLETSVAVANRWKEEFVVSENQKTNDLVFVHSILKRRGGPFCLSSDCLTGNPDASWW